MHANHKSTNLRKTYGVKHKKTHNINTAQRYSYTYKNDKTYKDELQESYYIEKPIRIPQCTNCGEYGHVYRNCLSPITSYGIIAVRFVASRFDELSLLCSAKEFITGIERPKDVQFLLIQRKDSLSFVEFIRGKYSPYDEEYVGKLLRGMTIIEQDKLLTQPFEELWKGVWGETSKTHKSDFDTSMRRFQDLFPRLESLIHINRSEWSEPEWGFPKGRRNPYESDIACAVREFQEETNLKKYQFNVLQNIEPISETFFGSNQIHYCHKYYISVCSENTAVSIQADNPHMAREIGNIEWCTLEEALVRIRPDNIEKREILLKVGRILRIFRPININHRDKGS
jgi:8-oxo-dGTP pyrophosphatase MutT (NUDIX family)